MRKFLLTLLLPLVLIALLPALGAAEPQLGDEEDFWIWDLSVMPPPDIQISATCIGVGEHVYIYVQSDRQGDFTQGKVDAVLAAFEESTPDSSIDPDLGIYQIETETFGPLSTDLDGLPGVFLLYYAMGEYNNFTFDGYFRSTDLTEGDASNRREMLHLNIAIRDPAGDYMLGIVAHELSHLLNNPKDISEAHWLSETLAEAAMILTGYPIDVDWVQTYADNPGGAGLYGDEHSVHYGAVFLMGAFLYESFGPEGLRFLVDDPMDGTSSVDQLAYDQWGVSYEEFFSEWVLSNLIDDPDMDYGYILIDVPALSPRVRVDGGETDTFTIRADAGAMAFAAIGGSEGWTITIDSDGPYNSSSSVLAVFIDEGGQARDPVTLSANGSIAETLDYPAAGDWNILLVNPDESDPDSLEIILNGGDEDDDDDLDDDNADDDDDDLVGVDDDDDDDDDDDGCGC